MNTDTYVIDLDELKGRLFAGMSEDVVLELLVVALQRLHHHQRRLHRSLQPEVVT